MIVKLDQVYLALAVLLISGSAFAAEWSYDDEDPLGPSNWEDNYPICGEKSQSPIDIDSTEDEDFGSITFTNFGNDIQLELENNGHSVQLSLPDPSSITFSSGGLPSTYTVAQFHFHWGSMSDQGSEHTVKGEQYDAELHIVGWDSVNFDTIADAQTETEGLAVLGIFIQEADNSDFESLTAEILGNVPNAGDTYTVDSGIITLSNYLPSDTDTFYRYNGSLTTPACYESVVWTVFDEVRGMTAEQLNAFRVLSSDEYGNETLVDNFRPVQDINSRVVYLNDNDSSGATLVQPKLLIPIICLIIIKYFN